MVYCGLDCHVPVAFQLLTGYSGVENARATFASHRQQPLLQKNQPRRSGNTAIPDSLLKYNRNFPAQQYSCPPRDFVLNRSDQLRSGSRDTASKDHDLGIEGVQETHQRGPQTLQRPIDDTACAFVTLGGSTKDSLGIRPLASAARRQFHGRGAVHMCPIIGFDGAQRKVCLQTAVIAANTQPAPRIERHMTKVPGRSARPTKDRAINQRRSANPGAQRQHNYVSSSASGTPEHFGDERGARVILGTDEHITGGDYLAQ